MLSDLSYCRPRTSCVIDAHIEDVWNIVRDWSRFTWIDKVEETPLEIFLVEGAATAVGSIRAVRMGASQYFERLVGLDDESHLMKWRLVSHPDSVSPFPEASFINFSCQLSLAEVTHGNQTFIEFRGSFYTEHEHTDYMTGRLEAWFHTALTGLQDYMKHRRDRRSPQASGSLSQQQRFAQPGINMDMPSRHSGERPFPVPPQGDFSMLNGRQGTDDLSSSDGSLERNRQMPSTSQQQQSKRPPSSTGTPPLSAEMQSSQAGQRQDTWTKLPSIGVGQSSQAVDMQRWAQMPSPNHGQNPNFNPVPGQQQPRNQWPPPPSNNWPYQ